MTGPKDFISLAIRTLECSSRLRLAKTDHAETARLNMEMQRLEALAQYTEEHPPIVLRLRDD